MFFLVFFQFSTLDHRCLSNLYYCLLKSFFFLLYFIFSFLFALCSLLFSSLFETYRTQVGFLTYDNTVQFYNLKHTMSQPQMMVCPDPNDSFLPIPEDLLVNLSESNTIVSQLLDVLPDMFKNNREINTSLGSAIEAGYRVMGQTGGKMIVFQSSLPSVGKGSLRPRAGDGRVLGTADEFKLLSPADLYYKTQAVEFSRQQICCEMFIATTGSYTDIATLSCLSKFTGTLLFSFENFFGICINLLNFFVFSYFDPFF